MVVQLHFPNQVLRKCDVVLITSETFYYIKLTQQNNLYNSNGKEETLNKMDMKSIYHY